MDLRTETAVAAFDAFAVPATLKRLGQTKSTPCRVLDDHAFESVAEGFVSELNSSLSFMAAEVSGLKRGDEVTITATGDRYKLIQRVAGDGVIVVWSASEE